MKHANLRKIYVLLWKNLILLKRQYIITACEILIPSFFAIFIALCIQLFLPQGAARQQQQPANTNRKELDWLALQKPSKYDETKALEHVAGILGTTYCNNTVPAVNVIGYKSDNELLALDILKKIADDAFQSLDCINNVKFVNFTTEDKMETYYSKIPPKHDKQKPSREFAFGIVFKELTNKTATYKIRLPAPDPKEPGPYSVFAEKKNYYFESSFAGIQLLLDKALIQHFTGNKSQYNASFQALYKEEQSQFNPAATHIGVLSTGVIYAFLFIVPTVVRGVVSEKETGIKEYLKMSGLPEWMHWLGWMLNSLMVFAITVTIITFALFRPLSKSSALFNFSSATLFWVILMAFVIWATTYCFAISAFFEKTTMATVVGIFIWYVLCQYIVPLVDALFGDSFSLGVTLLLCLLPTAGIYYTFKAFCVLEVSGKGANWGNMLDPISESDEMTVLYPFLMMLASSLLNMAICLYFEAVLPKKYGVRKPINFIFQPSEWGFSRKSAVNKVGDEHIIPSNEKPEFESEPAGIEAGVRIVNLRKEFGKDKIAVKDISLNIFKGEIFCLLGENGAGKTTTMSILTGITSPTSGTAFINGLDIKKDMDKIRQSLGLCPQHNMLFDKMTVFEHLKFFGMLKGLSSMKAKAEATRLLQVLKFPEKQNVLSKMLSGGQKRKLSLGCSLVGDAKVLFLDEPTSGMDPDTRRAIWDILLSIRNERTIVLTTHHMEEADVLGDRIAIMSSGELQCCGSPSFLKRFYGAGYVLSMTTELGADREKILSTVRNHIPDANFSKSHSNKDAELSVVLPPTDNICSSFPALFSELTKKQKDLGIDEIGVGKTTMDDVFVRVEELSHGQEADDNIDTENSMDSDTKPVKVRGLKLMVSQFYGLLMKDIIWTMRKKGLLLFQMFMSILFVSIAVSTSRNLFSTVPLVETPSLNFSLSSYKDPVTLYSAKPGIANAYAATVGPSAKPISSTFDNDVYKALLDVAKTDEASYRKRYIIAGEIEGTNMKAMYSTTAPHSAPLSMNMMTNTVLRLTVGAEYKINIINHPLRHAIKDLLTSTIKSEMNNDGNLWPVLGYIVTSGLLICTGFALLVGSFVLGPIEERLSKAKQLQLMTGVSPILYWGSKFIWDFSLIFITICLMTACLPIFEINEIFTSNGGAGVLFLIMVVYGISSLSFTYVLSTFIGSTSTGFIVVIMFHLLSGVILCMISLVLDILNAGGKSTIIFNAIGGIFPSFWASKGTMKYLLISLQNNKCYDLGLTKNASEKLCSKSFNPFPYRKDPRVCCDNCGKLGFEEYCFRPTKYLSWTWTTSIELAGIGQDLTWLALIPVVYFAILLMNEYGIFKMVFKGNQNAARFQRTVTDADVVEESDRISDLVAQRRTNEEAIVVHNFCKSYGNFRAVSMLSFGVHHGECFGLLGVNGAGKTTTFAMITGDQDMSSGNSYIQNLSLSHRRRQFMANLGYCPQFDAFVGGHTGKEMLYLFARLRGIPFRSVKKETEKWLKKTGLIGSGNVKCQKYSGGMKRRLNTAIALIGDPQVILLDEPTSGVDPFARRQFWKIITSVKNSGQSIILTSHSMEECDALCSRLGIMVNGEFQCFGGVQHLKSKFAQGYSLTIKLKQEDNQNDEVAVKIGNDVLNIFNPCSLKDYHQTTMQFQIHSQERSWEDLYKTMEEIKENYQGCFEEYIIAETTLEEVFLAFARAQREQARVVAGGKCQCFR